MKHPKIKLEKVLYDVDICNGEFIDLWGVDHKNETNAGHIRIYLTEEGKMKVFISDTYEVEVLEWKGSLEFENYINKVNDDETGI